MREIYSNKYKKVYKDTKTGEVKEVILDQEHRESVKKGDALQPVGKDKARFFGINKHLKQLKDGRIVDESKETQRVRELNENAEKEEREMHKEERIAREKHNPKYKKFY